MSVSCEWEAASVLDCVALDLDLNAHGNGLRSHQCYVFIQKTVVIEVN